MRPDLPVSEEDRHIESVAAHFVIELDDPECSEELREECADWLAADPRHRCVFEAMKRAWKESVILARRHYRQHAPHH